MVNARGRVYVVGCACLKECGRTSFESHWEREIGGRPYSDRTLRSSSERRRGRKEKKKKRKKTSGPTYRHLNVLSSGWTSSGLIAPDDWPLFQLKLNFSDCWDCSQGLCSGYISRSKQRATRAINYGYYRNCSSTFGHYCYYQLHTIWSFGNGQFIFAHYVNSRIKACIWILEILEVFFYEK